MPQHRSAFIRVPPPQPAMHEAPPWDLWREAGTLDLQNQIGEVWIRKVINRSGVTQTPGDLVAFDMFDVQAETSGVKGYLPFEADSAWNNVILPASANVTRGIFAVVLGSVATGTGDTADDAEMWVCVKGLVRAEVVDSLDTTVDQGDIVVPDFNSTTIGFLAGSIGATGSFAGGDNQGLKRLGFIMEDVTVVTDTPEPVYVLFDGFGFPGQEATPDQT